MSQARGTTKVPFTSTETLEQVEFKVTENTTTTHVRWTARVGRKVIANVTQRLVGSTCDSGELNKSIAAQYGVEPDAVTYEWGRSRGTRYVPKRGWVTLPAKPAPPQTCDHKAGEDACELPTCGGAPAFPVTLDRNVETAEGGQARGYESGVVTVGRELTGLVERMTGIRTSGLRFADNGWSDMRPGARKLDGWEFQVDDAHGPMHVQVLVYESKHPLDTHRRRYGAVYVGAARIVGDLDMEGPDAKWTPEVARHLAPVVQDLHDAVELANGRPDNGWRLKSVPPGHLIEHATGLAVVKESRVDGHTLLVHDLIGREHFVDRVAAGWWVVIPAARDARGDTFARFEQRMAWRSRLIGHRHQAKAHAGRPGDCLECIAEVMGAQDERGHHLGRYTPAPWCWFCGSRPGSPEAAQACPGLPKRLPADFERAAAAGEPTAGQEPLPPLAETFGSADAVYEVGDRVLVRVWGRTASGRVAVVEQVGDDRVYEVIRAGLGSTCAAAEQMRPDPTPAPEAGQTWVCEAIGASVTVLSVHEDGLTAETAERGAVILAAPNWRPGTLPVSADLARRARAFAEKVDRTDGELDSAIEANLADPSPKNEARVMAAMRRHAAAFQADERAELMAKQYGRPVPPINSGIPHQFVPLPEGEMGGPEYCVAPCHGHRTEPYHLHDAQAAPTVSEQARRGFFDQHGNYIPTGSNPAAAPTPAPQSVGEPDAWGDLLDLLGV